MAEIIPSVVVYAAGTRIKTKVGDIEMLIVEQKIEFNQHVTYGCSYKKDGKLEMVWLHEMEFSTSAAKGTTVGFRPQVDTTN